MALTPGEFGLLEKDYAKEVMGDHDVWDMRFANLMSLTYNMWRNKKSKKLEVQDFLPKKSKGDSSAGLPPQSAEALMSKMNSFLPPE